MSGGNLQTYWTTTMTRKLTVVLDYYDDKETYSRIGLLRWQGNLQSYWTTKMARKPTVVLNYQVSSSYHFPNRYRGDRYALRTNWRLQSAENCIFRHDRTTALPKRYGRTGPRFQSSPLVFECDFNLLHPFLVWF
jgi:hypothetical protein